MDEMQSIIIPCTIDDFTIGLRLLHLSSSSSSFTKHQACQEEIIELKEIIQLLEEDEVEHEVEHFFNF